MNIKGKSVLVFQVKKLMKRQSFALFDTNVTGKIDSKELRAAIQSLRFDIKNLTIYKLIAD